MTPEKKPLPMWLKITAAATAGAGIVSGGQKLTTDSPVHFAVVGQMPSQADGWKCEPEGGLIGAPLVCRPTTEALKTDTNTETK